MITSRKKNTNPTRIPALGLRFVVLLLASIALMWVDNRQNHLDALRNGIGAAVYPLQLIVDAPTRLWRWLGESATSRSALEVELNRLRGERRLNKARLLRLNALEAENARLRALLEAREKVRDPVRVAQIMSVDANPYDHNLVIGIGTRDGVFDGQVLVDVDGVVGQVIRAGQLSSLAMLISDTDHALPVEVNRNGLRTIAVGTGEIDRLNLPFVVNNADIQPGDLLVTSGLGGAFPPGYPVALVESVERIPQQPYAEVSATPTATLGQIREVMLIGSADEYSDDAVASEGATPDE